MPVSLYKGANLYLLILSDQRIFIMNRDEIGDGWKACSTSFEQPVQFQASFTIPEDLDSLAEVMADEKTNMVRKKVLCKSGFQCLVCHRFPAHVVI